ncbi:hypothetical protein EV174_004082 [Coemansia sp. RSA 2320]|nr:hypothetical protein EV174_004082 [Coemansia sp. RSA 2320]
MLGEQAGSGRLMQLYVMETDNDPDTYKAVVRPRIKAWVERVAGRRGTGWMVVYVASSSEAQRLGNSTFLGLRTSVFERVRSDVQAGRREAGEHAVLLQEGAVESWNTVVLGLRERVVQALEERVEAVAEETRRMDANRMLPGWNYGKFFVVKEGVVRLYRAMGLREEALAQYDELEAVYFQLVESQRLSWFSSFGGTAEGDDYSDVLNTEKRAYRRQMVENSISVFDFRMYLFGCQSQLLVGLGRFGELAERAQRFVAAFARTMREPGAGVGAAFVRAWTFSTLMNVAQILEGAGDGAEERALAAAKAELLAGARRQLDALRADASGCPHISNPVLAAALASAARFDQVYVRTCEQAAQYYAASGRRRLARAMQADVARLLAAREQWADAARVLRALLLEDRTEPPAQRLALLALLRDCECRAGDVDACVAAAVRVAEGGRGGARLRDACCALPGAARRVDGAVFRTAGAAAVGRRDAQCVALRVVSRVAVRADRVDAVLACGRAGARLEVRFAARDVDLGPDAAPVLLTASAVSCAARFVVASVVVTVGAAQFAAPSAEPLAVQLAELPDVPAVRLHAASAYAGRHGALRVAVHARAAGADNMAIRLFDARSGALLRLARTSAPAFSVAPGGGALLLGALPPGHDAEADVELAPSGSAHPPVAVTVCALWGAAPAPRRLFVASARVGCAPPLAVSAHAVPLGADRAAVVLRARAHSHAAVRLDSLTAASSEPQAAWAVAGAVLRRGDAVTSVREAAASDCVRVCGEAHFAMLPDLSTRTLRIDAGCVAAAFALAVRVEAAGAPFCRVLEPVAVAVHISAVGNGAGERRVHVSLVERDPGAWLMAGAVAGNVTLGMGHPALLRFALVPLAPGVMRLPDVVCCEGDAPRPLRRLPVLIDANCAVLRALPSPAAPPVFRVPVTAR